MDQNFATKADFKEYYFMTKSDMLEIRSKFKINIQELRNEMNIRFDDIYKRFGGIDKRLDDIKRINDRCTDKIIGYGFVFKKHSLF